MDMPQRKPQSLIDFQRRNEEVMLFEDFKTTEHDVHPGFQEETQFDAQRVEFRATKHRGQLKGLQQTFLSMLQNSTEDHDLKNEAESLDWASVIEQYTEYIRDTDAAKAKRSRFHNVMRKGSEIAGALNTFTSMIPDEKGLSVLRVGLAYILLAWKRHIEARNRVLETLAGVPETLANVHGKWKSYRDDKELICLVEDFEATILDSLIKLARIILSPPKQTASTWMKKVLKRLGEGEIRDVDEISKTIAGAMKMVLDRVDLLQHQRLGNVERTGMDILRQVQATRENTADLRDIFTDLSTRLSHLEQQRREIPGNRQQDDNVFFIISPAMASIMQTGLYGIVSEDQYIKRELLPFADLRPAVRQINDRSADYGLWPEDNGAGRPRTPLKMLIPVTKEDILEVLKIEDHDVPRSSAIADMQYVLRRSHSMEPRGLNQARSLMSKDVFKDFVARDGSGLLLVDGHCKSDGAGKTSPLSVWSASFIASLVQSDSILVMHFFCGLHAQIDPDDSSAGPLGLVKSLAAQLILHPSDPISRSNSLDRALLDGMNVDSFETLCEVFKSMIISIDSDKVLFIIVDNVSEFEGVTWNEWHDQTCHIFNLLYGLVQDRSQNPERRLRMKVLMTSANRSLSFGRMVKDTEVVRLRPV